MFTIKTLIKKMDDSEFSIISGNKTNRIIDQPNNNKIQTKFIRKSK